MQDAQVKKSLSLQMVQILKNACECHCESYECVVNEMRTQCMGYYLHTAHCGCFSLSISARLCLFSFKLPGVLIVHFRPAFYGNNNLNASKSLQMSYDHYKCPANNKNGLRLVKICY